MFKSEVRGYIGSFKGLCAMGITALCFLALLSCLSFFPIILRIDDTEATAIPSTTTLQMTLDHANATVDIVPTGADGSFAASTSTQEAGFTVTTNNITGYNLSISSANNSGQLTNSSTGTYLTSIAGAMDESTFSGSSSYNGKWGYKPSKINSTTNTNFQPSPTTSGTSLNTTTVANDSGTSDSYDIVVGARADHTTEVGTYEATFTLNVVANSVPYQINYLDNFSGSDVQYYQESNNNVTMSGLTLYAGIPTKSNYTFAGWCDGTVAHVIPGNSTCTGTVYQPGGDYSFTDPSSSVTNIINLYAMWDVDTYNLVVNGDIGVSAMSVRQGSTSGTVIDGVKSGDVITFSNLMYGADYYLYPVFAAGYEFGSWTKTDSVTDARLNSTTTENTYYTMGSGAGAITLTTEKEYMQDFTTTLCQSKASSKDYALIDKRDNNAYTVRYINGNCWMTQNLRYVGDSGSTSGSMVIKAATSNVDADDAISYVDLDSGIVSYDDAALHVATSGQVPSGENYTATDMGVWYNYVAASAGTIDGSYNNTNGTYDVCPRSWRLPSEPEQSGITSYADVYSPITGGFYYNGSPVDTKFGYWWSSTAYGLPYRYRLMWDKDNSSLTTNYLGRANGHYIRCILKQDPRTISDITTMQEVNPNIVINTPEGTTATLTDSRDGKTYTIAKINGNLWMTQNLRFTGMNNTTRIDPANEMSLDSTTSNVAATYTTSNTLDITYSELAGSNGTDYNSAKIHDSGNTTQGVWYNYAAMSAMTITGSSNTGALDYDICPAGWRLPTGTEQTNIRTYKTQYDPAVGGIYINGSISYPTSGYYWSATSASATNRSCLNDNGGANMVTGSNPRNRGLSARCIAKDS